MKAFKNIFQTIFLCTLFCCISIVAKADPDPWDDSKTDVPIDGGIGFLIAAGMVAGVRKVYISKKKPGNMDNT